MPGIRSGPREDNPFNRACTTIIRVAERVYPNNLGKFNGCVELVRRIRRVVEREEHAPGYNPYQEFANILKRDFPEVWNGDRSYSARQALEPWGVS